MRRGRPSRADMPAIRPPPASRARPAPDACGAALASRPRPRPRGASDRAEWRRAGPAGAACRACPRSVDRVADERPAARRAMDADLMGAAGERLQFEPAAAGAAPQHAPFGRGRLAGGIDAHPPAAGRGAPPEREVDRAGVGLRPALDHGPVGLGDPARLEYAVIASPPHPALDIPRQVANCRGGEDVVENPLQLPTSGRHGRGRERGDASGQAEGRAEPQLKKQGERTVAGVERVGHLAGEVGEASQEPRRAKLGEVASGGQAGLLAVGVPSTRQ